MDVRIEGVDLYGTECRTRVPFRFGAVTLRRATSCTARVRIASDVGLAVGYAADLAVPKWFEKDPAKPPEQDVRELLDSARAARDAFLRGGATPATPFAHWWGTYGALVHGCAPDAPDRLVRGFGVALVERALIDAACRAAGVSFFDALREDVLGFRAGELHAELDGWEFAASLPAAPRASIAVRHTVGMLDALRGADVAAGDRIDDGLPEALDEDIRRYGLRCFKLKIGAGPDDDFARLVAIAEVLRDEVGAGVTLTLDGNEQYDDVDALVGLLDRLAGDERGRYLLDGLLYVEQPLSRTATFARGVERLAAIAPVIIDEADSGLDSFPRAHALGYRGVSVKNCKGVFRALANRGLCERWSDGAFQAGEDLTNLGVLALQQDLATAAALDLEHVERNGHHYFHGLDHLPRGEARDALAAHPTLYEALGDGATLVIRGGELDLTSLRCVGYGYASRIDVGARRPL